MRSDNVFVAPRRDSIQDALIAALIGMSVFFIQALLVKAFANAMPFWDEWGFALMFKNSLNGTLSLADLFAQHNEHRILITRLLTLATFALMGHVWHPIVNMLVSALLNGVLAGIWMWTLARLIGWRWQTVLSVLLLVSLVQHENMFSGFQSQFYTLMLGIVGGACALALIGRLTWGAVVAALVGMFIATFSMASGILACGALFLGAALIAWRERGSLQALLRDHLSLVRLGIVAGGGILFIALFFAGASFPRLAEERDWRHTLNYLALALTYPVVVTTEASWWAKAGGAVLIWGPTLTVCALLMHRNEHRLLALFIVLTVFIAGSAGLYAIGRSDASWISSRYTTVLLWSSVLSLLALAILMRTICTIRRATLRRMLLLTYGIWSVALLSYQADRAISSFDEAHGFQSWKRQMEQNVRAFLEHSAPLAEPFPFPSREFLETQLSDPVVQSFLLPEIMPCEQLVPQAIEGSAWTLNGEYPSHGDAPPVRYGSWSGDDDHVGTFVSSPLMVREAYLIVPVVGYPSRPGNRLTIETADEAEIIATYNGPDLREQWGQWVVNLSAFQGREVRIVAVDETLSHGGWLGIGAPRFQNWQVTALHWFLEHLELVAAITLLGSIAVAFTFSNSAQQVHS